MPVQVGDIAPDFELKAHDGSTVKLSDYRGKQSVVVVFYPFAFSGICTSELCAMRDDIGAFQNDEVALLAVSCDPMYSLKAFAEQEGYPFPLLADFWPHGATATSYGVFNEDIGFAIRGTFLIDQEGVVRWNVVNSPAQARDLGEYKQAIAAL